MTGPWLELIGQRIRRRTGRATLDPVAAGSAIQAKAKRIVAQRPPQERGGSHHGEEHETEHDRAHDSMQQMAEPPPRAIQSGEKAGTDDRGDQECGTYRKAPPANFAGHEQWQDAEDSEHSGEHEAECAFGRSCWLLIALERLVSHYYAAGSWSAAQQYRRCCRAGYRMRADAEFTEPVDAFDEGAGRQFCRSASLQHRGVHRAADRTPGSTACAAIIACTRRSDLLARASFDVEGSCPGQ